MPRWPRPARELPSGPGVWGRCNMRLLVARPRGVALASRFASGGWLHGGIDGRCADHQMAGVVIEVLAANVVLAVRCDGVRGAADLGDQLADVAGPDPQQADLD